MVLPRRGVIALILGLAAGIVSSLGEPWPAAESDLPADPRLRSGTLENGLRYLVLPNAEPKNRISLRLVVAVGSLHENDDELGIAHFVEHMVFRGTRQHPAASLIESLQRLGVGLGPDNAAFTFYDHTIYHLELPDATEATLREALGVFREYAQDVTFDEKLIERERGVLVSENATRDTPAERSGRANLAFLWPDSRHVRRPIGGTPATLRQITRDQLVAFYDAWYRPERIAVVVAGDLEPARTIALVTSELGPLRPRALARPEPTDLAPVAPHSPDVAIFADPGLLGVQLTLEHPVSRPREKQIHAVRLRAIHEALAFGMLQSRFQRISHEPAATFVSPSVNLRTVLPEWELAAIGVSGKIDDWQQVAAQIEQEHRRAFQFGFTAQELDVSRANLTSSLEESVRTRATWRSDTLATQLAADLVAGNAFVAPEVMQRDVATALAGATAEDCLRAFRAVWTAGAPHVFIAANPSFHITREQIAAALNASRATDVTSRHDAAQVAFAYGDFGPPGRLVRDETLPDLDARLTAFANGVRLNFKTTKFEADLVEVHVRVGDGKLSQPKDKPGLDLLANTVLTAGGVGRHTAEELTSLLAGRQIGVSFSVDTDACVFALRCAQRDLPVALQLVAVYLTDAAYRPESLRDSRAALSSMYMSLATAPSGAISMDALRKLSGGDPRFGIPRPDDVFARTLDELKAWLEPQLKHGPIELSVVGDISWSEAEAAVARTLGALPPRGERKPNPEAEALTPPRAPVAPAVYGLDPKVKQAAIAWYFPVPPSRDFHEIRRCYLLAAVLAERVRVRVREELGAAYSVGAAFVETKGFPHLNHFVVYAEVAPAHVNQAMLLVQRETMSLALKGLEADEFERAKAPFLHEWDDNLRTNAYWGITVLGSAQQEPSHLAAARDRGADIASITSAELSALAPRYLDASNAFKFAVVAPSGAMAPSLAATVPVGLPSAMKAFPMPGTSPPVATELPVPVYQARPIYPPEMIKQRTRGEVLVDFIVDIDGTVQNATAVKQTNDAFAQSAIDCVKQWRFRPASKAGKPIRTHMQVPIVFEPSAGATTAAPANAPSVE
jgi:zinc protease